MRGHPPGQPEARARSEAVRNAAKVIVDVLRDRDEVAHQLRELLLRSGRVRSTLDLITIWPQAFDRVVEAVRLLMESVLADVALDQTRIEAIRRFFLDPRATYTAEELATLWRVTLHDAERILEDELATRQGAHSAEPLQISHEQALRTGIAFNLIRPFEIETALAEQFERVRDRTWRTTSVLVHLPNFVVTAIASEPILRQQQIAACIEQFVLDRFLHENKQLPPDEALP